MPQLDCYFFFSMFATFQLFFVGLLFFSIFVVPHSIFLIKFSGCRMYYYYVSLLILLHLNADSVVISYYRVISISFVIYMRIALQVAGSSATYCIVS